MASRFASVILCKNNVDKLGIINTHNQWSCYKVPEEGQVKRARSQQLFSIGKCSVWQTMQQKCSIHFFSLCYHEELTTISPWSQWRRTIFRISFAYELLEFHLQLSDRYIYSTSETIIYALLGLVVIARK